MRALLFLLLTATLAAAELKVGDPAPATRPETMIQGEAVQDFKKGEVSVFECWASWCGPCVAAIPHLNELHQKLGKKGVVIMGINVWESERDDASAMRARNFVKMQGEKMSYRIALGGNAFVKDWLEAAGVTGIPHAFVVHDGKIAWMGHPMQITDELLGDILTGTPLAVDPLPVAAARKKKTASADPVIALEQAKLDALSEAMARQDWAAAEKALPTAAAVLPPEERKEMIESVEAQIAFARGDPSKVYAQLAKVAKEESDDAEAMNEIAWTLLTNPRFEKFPNLTLAEKCAVQAVKLTKEQHPDKLDTLARLRWMQGRQDESLRLQRLSVERASEPRMKKLLQETLDSMEKGVLPKADNSPLPEEK